MADNVNESKNPAAVALGRLGGLGDNEERVNTDAKQIRKEVFGCEWCDGIPAFQRPPTGGSFYKFPPIIGAQGPAQLLFVGINPRRSDTNRELHNWLMQSPDAFAQLAENRQQDGRPYVAHDGDEEHYRCHAVVVEGVFVGHERRFESKAAVTELYFCASESGSELLELGRSPCAERYLSRVIDIVKPSIVIAVGWKAHNHLGQHFSDIIRCRSVRMEHPRYLRGLSNAEKQARLRPTIEEVVKILKNLRQQSEGSGASERAACAQI